MPAIAALSRLVDNAKVGGVRGLLSCAMPSAWASFHPRRFGMRGSDFPSVFLRPGTADVQAYRQVFERAEYECPVDIDPRLIVDAGAHIGLASLFMASRYPAARILAVEPHPANLELLHRNTENEDRITVIHGALVGSSGPVRIVNPNAASWAYQVDADTVRAHDSVRGYTLQELAELAEGARIDLLKLDIEGAEKAVLEHADDVLSGIDTIVAELHDRIVPGCSRVFFTKTTGFKSEWSSGELFGVSRSPLLAAG